MQHETAGAAPSNVENCFVKSPRSMLSYSCRYGRRSSNEQNSCTSFAAKLQPNPRDKRSLTGYLECATLLSTHNKAMHDRTESEPRNS